MVNMNCFENLNIPPKGQNNELPVSKLPLSPVSKTTFVQMAQKSTTAKIWLETAL